MAHDKQVSIEHCYSSRLPRLSLAGHRCSEVAHPAHLAIAGMLSTCSGICGPESVVPVTVISFSGNIKSKIPFRASPGQPGGSDPPTKPTFLLAYSTQNLVGGVIHPPPRWVEKWVDQHAHSESISLQMCRNPTFRHKVRLALMLLTICSSSWSAWSSAGTLLGCPPGPFRTGFPDVAKDIVGRTRWRLS